MMLKGHVGLQLLATRSCQTTVIFSTDATGSGHTIAIDSTTLQGKGTL